MSDHRLDLDRYLALPRLAELDLSPDGRFLAFTAARVSKDGKKFVRDLWRVASDGSRAPERLSRGEASAGSPRFLADGSLLFLSARPDPEQPAEEGDEEEPTSGIWLLPPCGEPRCLTHRAGHIEAFAVARSTGALLFRAEAHPETADLAQDRERARAHRKSGASGLVFDQLPIRFWDRFFGPRFAHLFFAPSLEDADRARDLTPGSTIEHDDLSFDLALDGRLAVASERERDAQGRMFENLRVFDLAAGKSWRITKGEDSYVQPRFAPDGRSVVAVFHENVQGRTGRQWLVEVPSDASAPPRAITADLDLWPESPVWSADGRELFFVADERGHHPLFRVARDGSGLSRLSAHGAATDPVPSPDGARVFALGHSYDRPPEVIALEAGAAAPSPRPLTGLATRPLDALGLVRPEARVARRPDGREVHSWLLKPASPPPPGGFPLLLWVHGGPLGAWADGWQWRWNAQLFVARGHAVLQVNPRISTGYGQAFLEEGFARWGAEPYEDLMAALDEAVSDPTLDASRCAAMGGSFGGYMANWIAGHTQRFRCIVSHAGMWHMTGFHGTTDCGPEWEREFGGDPYRNPEVYERWSPHHHVRAIRTPMLIIHGEKDFRVPVAEAFQVFTALQRLGVPSRLLYFPDENHWILRPPNIRTWYENVFAWLDRWLAPGAERS